MSRRKNKLGTRETTNGTVSCHVRFPKAEHQWLAEKAQEYRSIQEKIIEIVRAARKADEYQQEQTA
jgi:DNA gyrase/topoisomerase IV subunit B